MGATDVADELLTNVILAEPTLFVSDSGPVSIIRPIYAQQGGAVPSVISFVRTGSFLIRTRYGIPE
jgi:hypothetical protein